MPPQPSPRATVEQVVNIRKHGSGYQYEVKWVGHAETTWEAASRVKREIPDLVAAFEQQQHQQQQEGAAMDESEDRSLSQGELRPQRADENAMREQMAALEQLVRDQAQQLQQLRASPQQSPQQSPRPTPYAAAPQQSRFAHKEPRANDLREYDGASGAKLEEWLQELAKVARLFRLNDTEAVDFGVSRLTGAALQWSLALDASQQATLVNTAALASALRTRFQPLAITVLARDQLDRLQQGARSINDYIAEFQRLRAQLPDMGEADALHAFGRGLRMDLREKLREHNVTTVQAAIDLAARVGGLRQAAAASTSRAATAAQMEVDESTNAMGTSLDARMERLERTMLNALQSGSVLGDNSGVSSFSGLGAKTQTQRGYADGRSNFRGRGGAPSRGGRFGGQREPPRVPGVPEDIVRQRIAAQQCVRCGVEGHRSPACPNAISSN